MLIVMGSGYCFGEKPMRALTELTDASPSVQQAFIKYLAERNISESTRTAYRSCFYTSFDGWLSRSISSITDEEIGERKRQLLRRGQSFATMQQALRLMGVIRESKPRVNVPVQLVTGQSVTDVTAETLTLRRIWTDYPPFRPTA